MIEMIKLSEILSNEILEKEKFVLKQFNDSNLIKYYDIF